MTCRDVEELLAAFADGGLDGREHERIAAHISGCAACTGEVAELRAVLGQARRAAPRTTAQAEEFWQGFTREVRLRVSESRPSWWNRLRVPLLVATLAAGLALVLLVGRHGPASQPPRTAHAARPLPATFDIDDLDDAEVVAALAAFEESAAEPAAADQEDDDEELAQASLAAADEAIEDLDDDALARAGAAL